MASLLKMSSFVGQVFLVVAIHLYVYVCAQNETSSVEGSSTETNKSCTHNVTGKDYVCEGVQNTTEVMLSTKVRKDSDDVSVTGEVVDVESTLPSEVIYLGNETETELLVNITSVKSDIPTTQQPNSTMEPISATTEMVKEARPLSSDICTCDLNVSKCSASIEKEITKEHNFQINYIYG